MRGLQDATKRADAKGLNPKSAEAQGIIADTLRDLGERFANNDPFVGGR
jgi:3-methyladenine DNA glycosylase AlkD